MAIVERSAELAAPAEAVWRAVKTPSAFRTVTRGILTMPVIKHRDDGWRDGETVQGMTLSSQESGGVLRRWNHDIVVRPVNDAGCHYTDRIDIDAGIFTPFVAGYARWFYKNAPAELARTGQGIGEGSAGLPKQVLMNQPSRHQPRSSMKHTISAFAASAIIAVASGCSADPSAKVPTGADLKGTWIQAGDGYERGIRVTPENQGFAATVVIAEADGQGFTGYKEHTDPGEKPQRETLHGVVGLDGDILITDEDGYFTGKLVDGKIRGQFAEIGKDAAAINVELSRQ